MPLTIVATADTHGLHNQLVIPDGDILVVAGDISSYGMLEEVEEFSTWLQSQPHQYKIVIAGNHDSPFEVHNSQAVKTLVNGRSDIIYLQDSPVVIEGITFYGSPWTPTFMNWYFMADRGLQIRERWDLIPSNADVLITHGPPAGILDYVRGLPLGCTDLLGKVMEIMPKYHIFGHIHEGYGYTTRDGITFVNASACDGRYRPINPPVVLEL